IFYNRDFYCIQIHDDEVACDGLLFNNIHNMPIVRLDEGTVPFFSHIFGQITTEFALQDPSIEEMIRTYLKQLFIKAARLWKRQNLNNALVEQQNDLEFFRKFTMLVEEHYRQKHHVADYAELLGVAPKTITHKFKRLKLPLPNDVIKNRIVMEAKRMLAYTDLTSKEIGYILGYGDPAYFSRLFLQKAGECPSGFRTKFLSHDYSAYSLRNSSTALCLGLLASLFFAVTFIVNRLMSLECGSWIWSASLRFFWMLPSFL